MASASTARPAVVLRVAAYEFARAGDPIKLPLLKPTTDQRALIVDRARPHTRTSWPWLAAGGILATLGAISFAARRRLPFGNGRV